MFCVYVCMYAWFFGMACNVCMRGMYVCVIVMFVRNVCMYVCMLCMYARSVCMVLYVCKYV